MIYNEISEYIEQKRIKRALKGCVEAANEEGYITIDEVLILFKTLEKYIPEEKNEL